MMSDNRPDADTCRDCGRVGRERDGCGCINAAFNDLMRIEAPIPRQPCECKCDGYTPHADRLCGNGHERANATEIVALHRWGWCDDPPDANCDEDGNLTALMCGRCADHAEAVGKAQIRLMMSDPDNYGRDPHCPACHRPTTSWEHLVKRRHI